MKVISNKNLPTRVPTLTGVTFWLLLDRLGAPGWAWGVYWTLLTILVIAAVVSLILEDPVDLFDDLTVAGRVREWRGRSQ